MPSLIQTFGLLSLHQVSDGSPSDELLGMGKPVALLAYLDASPRREATRDHLVGLLWADTDPASARHALRQTLWYIKRKAGDGIVENMDDVVVLGAAVRSDRGDFLEAVNAGRYADATQIYTADYIPSFGAPGCATFEQWADRERDGLRATFSRAGEVVVHDALSKARTRDAHAIASRMCDLAPQIESNWRLLLEAAIATGDAFSGAAVLRRVDQHFRDEEQDPEPATRALMRLVPLDGVRKDNSTTEVTVERSRPVGDLVGREIEYAAIVAGRDRAQHGFVHIHVTGGAGLGKSRLLHDVELRFRAMRSRGVTVSALHGEREISCAFCARLALELAQLPGAAGISPGSAAILVALAPSLSSTFSAAPDVAVGEDGVRRRLHALTELVCAVSEERTIVMLLDDMHWLDESSRRILAGLAGQLTREHVLLVTASRNPAGIGVSASAVNLALAPLSEAELLEFLISLGTLPDLPWVQTFASDLVRFTSGSPLLIVESLALAQEQGLLELQNGVWHTPFPDGLARLMRGERAITQRVRALPRAETWLLQLLALAGVQVATSALSSATSRPEMETLAHLGDLEHRGLAVRDGDSWLVAHDEIADAALEGLAADGMAAAHAALGAGIGAIAGPGTEQARLAARHLVRANDNDRVRDLLRNEIRFARGRRDHRSAAELATGLIGAENQHAIRTIVRTLSWRERGVSLHLVRLAAAMALVAFGAVVVALTRSGPALPDATLVVLDTDDAGHPSLFSHDLRARSWSRASLSRNDARVRTLRGLDSLPSSGYTLFPDGSIGYEASIRGARGAHSTSIEAMLLPPRGGAPRQLTDNPADDNMPIPAPDGRLAAFSTNRWDPVTHHSDLAVLDLATLSVRQLTNTPSAFETAGPWSPDGRRIAFTRSFQTEDAPELCTVGVDGGGERCVVPARYSLYTVLAWDGLAQALVTVESEDGSSMLARIRLSDGTVTVIDHEHAYERRAAPDGKWIACLCVRPDAPSMQWYVHPVDHPERARLVAGGTANPGAVEFARTDPNPAYIDRIVVRASGPIEPGQSMQLQATSYGRDRSEIATPLGVRWASLDSTVASVNAFGVLHANKEGVARIITSINNVREDTTALRVMSSKGRSVLLEHWDSAPERRWVFFGVPRAAIVRDSLGFAMWNHGNGDYSSGVLLRQRVLATRGMGVAMTASLPHTKPQWQTINVSLLAGLDDRAMAGFDFNTGTFSRRAAPVCLFTLALPAGESGVYTHRLSLLLGSDGRLIEARPLLNGDLWNVQVQFFADGRGAAAVNGHVVWRSVVPISSIPDSVSVMIYGNSVGTRVLVRTVEVWEGVREDIDWTAPPISISQAASMPRGTARAAFTPQK